MSEFLLGVIVGCACMFVVLYLAGRQRKVSGADDDVRTAENVVVLKNGNQRIEVNQ